MKVVKDSVEVALDLLEKVKDSMEVIQDFEDKNKPQ